MATDAKTGTLTTTFNDDAKAAEPAGSPPDHHQSRLSSAPV